MMVARDPDLPIPAVGPAVLASIEPVDWGVVFASVALPIGILMKVFGVIGLALVDADFRELTIWIDVVPTWRTAPNLTRIFTQVVAWLWPTAVGVPLIIYLQGKHANHGPLAGLE